MYPVGLAFDDSISAVERNTRQDLLAILKSRKEKAQAVQQESKADEGDEEVRESDEEAETDGSDR